MQLQIVPAALWIKSCGFKFYPNKILFVVSNLDQSHDFRIWFHMSWQPPAAVKKYEHECGGVIFFINHLKIVQLLSLRSSC